MISQLEKRRTPFVLLITPVLLVLLTLAGMLFYQRQAVLRCKTRTYCTLQESAEEQTAMLRTKLEGRFVLLESFAGMLAERSESFPQDVLHVLSAMVHMSDFSHVYIALPDGTTYDEEGRMVALADERCFAQSLRGARCVEKRAPKNVGDASHFILSVPVQGANGEVAGVVLGDYHEAAFRSVWIAGAREWAGYSFVCDARGDVMIGSDDAEYLLRDGNVLALLQTAQMETPDALQRLRDTLTRGEGGMVAYTLGGERRYAVYQPIGINDWMIFQAIPASIVDAAIQEVLRAGYALIGVTAAMAMLLIIFILALCKRQIRRLSEEKKRLQASDERFRVALQNTTVSIWEYDYKTKCMAQAKNTDQAQGAGEVQYDVPESLVKNGVVHPESVPEFLAMYEKLAAGALKAEGVFKMRGKGQTEYGYEHIQYTNLFNEDGVPYRAIGMSENVTDQHETMQHYQLELQFRQAMTPDIDATVLFNVTRGTTLEVYCRDADEQEIYQSLTFETIFSRAAERVVEDEDARRRLYTLNAQTLQKMFVQGERTMTLEYLRRNAEQGSAWFTLELHLLCDPASGDLLAFLYLRNIDEHKRTVTQLRALAEHDAMTGMLNHDAMFAHVQRYLETEGAHGMHALLVIDVDCFKRVNDLFGHQKGDEVIVKVANVLKKLFHAQDILGRIGGDEFMVLYKNVSLRRIQKKCAALCERLQFVCMVGNASVELSCSVGVTVYDEEEKSFDAVYREADAALYKAKAQGKNQYCFSDDALFEQSLDNGKEPMGTLQMRALLEYLEGGVMLLAVGEDIERLYVSPSYYTMIRRKAEEFVGREERYDEMINAQDVPAFEEALRVGARQGSVVDHIYRACFGEQQMGWRRILAVSIPYPACARPVLLAIISDVTELKETSNRLQALLHYMVGGVVLADVDEASIDVTYASPGFAALIGITPEEMQENQKTLLSRVYAKDRPALEQTIHQGMRDGTVIDHVYRALSTGGQVAWRHIRAVRMPDDGKPTPTLIAVITDISELKMQEQQLRLSEERFRIALEQTRASMWEVDLATRVMRRSPTSVGQFGGLERVENIPEGFLQTGIVDADSASTYARLFERMYAGDPTGAAVVQTKLIDQSRMWVKLSFTLLYDEERRAYCALGITEMLPNIDAQKALFEQEEQLSVVLADALIGTARFNLTTGNVDWVFVPREERYRKFQPARYEEMLAAMMDVVADAQSRHRCMMKLSMEALSDAFRHGKSWIVVEYCRRSGTNQIQWASATVNLLHDPISGQLYGFGYIRDIDKRRRWELSLHQRIECDMVSFLYTRETTEALVRHLLSQPHEKGARCAMTVVELNGLDRFQDELGMDTAGDVVFAFGRLFRIFVDATQVVGRVDEFRFVFFDVNVPEDAQALQHMDQIKEKILSVRHTAYPNDTIRIATGMATARMEDTGCEQLYERAVLACEEASYRGEEHTLLYAEKMKAKPVQTPRVAVAPLVPIRDASTGLLNRQSYYNLVRTLNPDALSSLGVVFIDINGLGQLNRKLGMQYGDAMISFIGEALIRAFGRQSAYRISGDEFLVICPNLMQDAFLHKSDEAWQTMEATYAGAISMGRVWDEHITSVQQLIDHAQEHMMAAKKASYQRGGDAANDYLRTQQWLTDAMQRKQFHIYLQPKANIRTGEICGCEALVRWVDEEKGVVSPDRFIPMLERENLIHHLDFYVFSEMMKLLEDWQRRGLRLLPISVNFSKHTLLDANTFDAVQDIQKRAPSLQSLIEIEITESVGSMERATVMRACDQYRAAGYRLALDDFGSEYSSLYILTAIPFDVVKIDKSVIHDLATNRISRITVESVIRICKEAGAQVVAEGVETEEQLTVLRALDCAVAQGYLFNKPLPIPDYERNYG